MATLYPMTEVFFKRGFNDSSVSSEYTEEAAHVLRLHGYTPRVVDAVSHCTYIKEIATPCRTGKSYPVVKRQRIRR
ncbi:MAG: hypothetical protein RQM92_09400 [Candidatus Syntrophopropionicum ammoniitolerans]